jgi:hypothetical protein
MTRRGLWIVNLALFAALAGSFAVAAMLESRSHDDQCNQLTAIASDPQKVAYVRAWMASRSQDERFMTAVKTHARFDHDDPGTRQSLDLDWQRLGLSPINARLEFNDGFAPYVRTLGIRSVSLYQGRSGIIIGLNAGDLGLGSWGAEEVRKLRRVGDGVYVYCDVN